MNSRETAAAMQAIADNIRTSTEFIALLGSQIINSTLEVWSGPIPATGHIARDWPVAAGAIRVRNLSESDNIYVSSAGPAETAPTGFGTAIVPPGGVDTIPLASHQVTIYGTAADLVAYQVFTAGVRPATG